MFQKKNIPNLISISRIFLALISIILFFLNGLDHHVLYAFKLDSLNLNFKISPIFFAGAIFFIISSITDFLDGYLARKWKVVSDLGKIIDPISDKILVNGVLIALIYNNQIVSGWIFLIIFIRDILVDAFRIYAASKKIIIPANKWGKFKTLFQMIGIILVVLVFSAPLNNYTIANLWFYYLIQNGLILLSSLLALISLYGYFKVIAKELNFKK